MRILLWLDDSRDPHKNDWLVFSPIERPFQTVWLKSYEEFTEYITLKGLPDGICFDHDLGQKIDPNVEEIQYYRGEISNYSLLPYDDNEKTGYDCAKWLVDYCLDLGLQLPLYNIQSANPVGKANIDGLLKSFNKNNS